jgi:L-2-hydroxycarboxylate dehydrogenase (NAD+)
MDVRLRFADDSLRQFCAEALAKLGVPLQEAQITADVLIYADLRGIDSHGIAHLKRYVNSIRSGNYLTQRDIVIVHQTPSTALVDGGGGLGYPTAVKAMQVAIEKATAVGSACVAARNSHHFGAAGYYACMALEHDMIGFSITNAGPAVVPTFGVKGEFGTNPIALAVPADKEPPFVLDMATSVKATGKVEILIREGKDAPPGWFVQADGSTGGNPEQFLSTLIEEDLGGQLPLGGQGEITSGYKGYGLGLGIELLGPVLAGDIASPFMPRNPRRHEPTIAHFFGAIRVDAFRPAAEFKADVDRVLAQVKASPKAPGHDRIWVAGEKEYDSLQERSAHGIPLHQRVIDDLNRLADELDISRPLALA